MTARVEDHGDHESVPMLGLEIDLEFIAQHAMCCIAMSRYVSINVQSARGYWEGWSDGQFLLQGNARSLLQPLEHEGLKVVSQLLPCFGFLVPNISNALRLMQR